MKALNTQETQFIVAISALTAMFVLALVSLVFVGLDMGNSVVTDVLMLLVGGLIATCAAASAFLFRLNGNKT